MSYFDDYLLRKRTEHGDKFDPSDLAPQFVPYLHEDQRIKVRTRWGEELTGTVGVTTGWRPAFLLMRRTSAYGSSTVLGKDDQIIAVKAGKYVPVQEEEGAKP